ncbi:flagellin [Vibrio parahaemolyticus]|nr:flagellin [Vibrio parahaemolyticus]
MLSVNTNIVAMKGLHGLHRVADSQSASMERLSSGKKINNAKDDAAGLQISNRLHAQSRGMDVAIRNANDGMSMLQTAEGAMNEYTENLTRMRDLTLRYANGSLATEDRTAISQEYSALKDELNRIIQTTSYAGQKLLNGENSERMFQVGANAGEAIRLTIPDFEKFQEEENQVTSKITRFRAVKPSSLENWRAFTDFTINFEVFEGNYTLDGNEPISIELPKGSSLNDIVDEINDQHGDKMRAFIDEEDLFFDNGRLASKGPRLSYYALADNSRVLWRGIDAPAYFGGPFRGEGGEYAADIEEESFFVVPDLYEASSTDTVLDKLDAVLHLVDSERAKLGTVQNRLSHAINNLSQSSENVVASKSQIRDTDFAKETTNLTKQSILKEVGTSLLAQAKDYPRNAVSLLS